MLKLSLWKIQKQKMENKRRKIYRLKKDQINPTQSSLQEVSFSLNYSKKSSLCLDSSNITLDESLETTQAGATGIVVSLPKQKYLSYLFKFSNPEGKFPVEYMDSWTRSVDASSFKKALASVKAGRNIEGGDSSQFDERTEESSAEQYFQVEFLMKRKDHLQSIDLVLWLFISTTKYDAGLYSYFDLSTSNSR